MKQVIWTEAYRPFIMGGDCHAPIATEVEVGEPVELGHGIKVFVISSPSGHIHIAESITGAFVGSDIDLVKADVAEGDPEVMGQQVTAAKKRFKRAEMMSSKKFWRMFEGSVDTE